MGSWSDIPRDVLEAIAEKLTHVEFLRFGAVCKSWRLVTVGSLHRLPRALPMRYCLPRRNLVPLLLRSEDEDAVEFFSIFDKKCVSRLSLPEIIDRRFFGCSNGWLVTGENNSHEVHLLNPFTRAQTRLPSLATCLDTGGDEEDSFWFIEKAVVSSDPTEGSSGDNCVVVAIVTDWAVLSYCRPGDDKWTEVNSFLHLTDVIYYKDHFYAINAAGTTMVFDAAGDGNMKVIIDAVSRKPRTRHLVQSVSGSLLQVVRIVDKETEAITTGFSLYQLEVINDSKIEEHNRYRDGVFEWVKLADGLGDQVMFLDRGSSTCLPAESVPGFKRNCIYFINDDESFCRNRIQSIGRTVKGINYDTLFHYGLCVFDMENRSIEPVGETKKEPYKLSAWFLPNPW